MLVNASVGVGNRNKDTSLLWEADEWNVNFHSWTLVILSLFDGVPMKLSTICCKKIIWCNILNRKSKHGKRCGDAVFLLSKKTLGIKPCHNFVNESKVSSWYRSWPLTWKQYTGIKRVNWKSDLTMIWTLKLSFKASMFFGKSKEGCLHVKAIHTTNLGYGIGL